MTVKLTILGATGTIGVNTLDVVARHADRFEIFALTANANVEGLFEQCQTWNPRYAVMVQEEAAAQLAARCHAAGLATEVLAGTAALVTVAAHAEVDYVMAGIVGAAGLLPNLAAAQAGKRVMLANKESLVMSGHLFMDAVRESGAELLPIDSEHNAVFQCMPADFGRGLPTVGVERILLTASGGPFRTVPLETLRTVTPAQAVAHPNWVMGRKISVDSATMMNKALEVVEAHWLFDLPPERIRVVVHPQSIVHSMVVCRDASVLAQLGTPDMRVPIAYGLAWPERIEAGAPSLDFLALAPLTFEPAGHDRFPALALAYQALAAPEGSTAVLNAANEEAVAAFLAGTLRFPRIHSVNARTVDALAGRIGGIGALDDLHVLDARAREVARGFIRELAA